ncbi:RNI-like protein [Rhizopus microsporus ATCC 52813]|uniref:RNI-like protein n=1 Tax=Rhizopus microsporus ATCC 52813 TaxID=1340429 RepID=A0A2G4T4M4_RHIZD|nr:RNI-like protein [Rhizopus microsporus ATCC 52813]PHZ15626.1 RNI-like protein [Rhizopus microsporus ATCC 52813]
MIEETLDNSKFMQLPDELQIKILAELPIQDLLKSTVVCRKWNQLVFDGSLWTKLNVAPFYKIIPIDYLLKLIKASSGFLKTANFRGCIQFNGHALRTLSDHCPNIQVLIIKDCRGLSSASITYFLQRAHQLRVLDVSGLDTVKNSTLAVAGSCLGKLEKLNLSWCRNITGHGILPIITSCSTHLRYLKLNGCPQLDDNTMELLGQHLPNLTYLSLAACTSLTDTGVLSFLSSGKGSGLLTHLNLSSCARLTDATLRHLSQYAVSLTHLELSGCVLMTDQGFCYLAPRLKTLVYLDLEDLQQITGITVRAIANNQPELKRLCLSNCTHISDDAITHLILHGVCHKLQHLELDNCTITDEVLNTIAVYLQQLKKALSESAILNTSIDSNISLFSSTSPSRERQMNVEVLDCSNITESGVREAMAKAGPMLTIKSFYTFQNTTSVDSSLNRHSISGRGTRANHHRAATMSQTANNCIIL